MREDEPFEHTDGGLRSLEWGCRDGELATLLLHGFTGAAESFAQVVACWRQRPHGPRRLIAPDLPGHHVHSPPGDGGFGKAVDRLGKLLDARGIRRCRVVGYSMGARAGLGLAVRHPERVTSAVLIGVNPGLRSLDERRERALLEAGWARRLRDDGIEDFMRSWERLALFRSQRSVGAAERETQWRIRCRHDAASLARALELLGLARMPDYWPQLRRVRIPVELVAGSLDVKFVELARRAAESLPAGRVTEVPGCGHNVLLEDPRSISGRLDAGKRDE